MELRRLRIQNLRLIEQLELELASGWNLFLGTNGAGKTSLLEAAFLLSHGRSFRVGGQDALVRHGSSGYSVYGELETASSAIERVGLARNGGRLVARLAGESIAAAELMRHTAVLCFEPGSHELISGPSEERRRFLDWGVFHVEHDFLLHWRRYQRALKQRNALLRGDASGADLDVWDQELARAAEPLTMMRRDYFDALRPILAGLLRDLLAELGEPQLAFHPGFEAERPLAEVLAARRARDLARGHTSAGPHRADWSIGFETAPRREHLSRGQEKLCAFACVMAQAHLFAQRAGEYPVVCLDDLASEVDQAHQRMMVATVAASGAQVLATGTEEPAALAALGVSAKRFHVEQGRAAALL
ncbi:DNA replication/repair protein RecF [Dokdonella soli]|uniref:DNA replication and repair protein RecF n=1 Tax=Dokdonella soli TaxID=529810 RepID=A0ABP3TM55_9GAMM